ncbi:MAG: cytochrome-c peroxidase [Bdellovibrionales bacterium]
MNGFFSLLLLIGTNVAWGQTALPEAPPTPKDNPPTKEKIELGRQLFFDPRLSQSGTVSCNSCHNVMAGGEDGRRFAAGVGAQLGDRNSPTVWNAAFQTVQFWDGRAGSLEDQAKGPLVNPIEMGMKDHDVVVKDRISKIPGYVTQFKKVFGGRSPVTINNIAKAIAAFERTLITPNSPFDRYIKGDKTAMSKDAIMGFETFKTTGCVACHQGSNFSGPDLPVGTGFYQKFPTYPDSGIEKKYAFTSDPGRFKHTKQDSDKGLFRVPSLRNIALTAPYFHNGAVTTLEEAIRVMAKLQLNKTLKKAEIKSIAAFLTEGLTGEFPKIEMPRLPSTPGWSLTAEEK